MVLVVGEKLMDDSWGELHLQTKNVLKGFCQ